VFLAGKRFFAYCVLLFVIFFIYKIKLFNTFKIKNKEPVTKYKYWVGAVDNMFFHNTI